MIKIFCCLCLLYKQTVYLKLYFNNNNNIKILFINILNKKTVLLKIIFKFQKCFQTSFHKHQKITNDPEFTPKLLAESLLNQRHAKQLLPNPHREQPWLQDGVCNGSAVHNSLFSPFSWGCNQRKIEPDRLWDFDSWTDGFLHCKSL